MADMINAQETAQPLSHDDSPLSQADAFKAIIGDRGSEEPQERPAPEQDSGNEPDNDAVAETQPSDDSDTGQDDTEALPPIEPPASWTKEERKAWETLPRDLQESIADRERARRADVDRRLNEAAKIAKAAEARELAAEQARKNYEDRIPQLQNAINAQYASEFGDIQTWDDVRKLAAEDPARYTQWQAFNDHAKAIAQEAQQTQQRQQAEASERARQFLEEQNKLFMEKVPDFASPEKALELRRQAFDTLTDIGFAKEDIGHAWDTGGTIPVHDHRFQMLVYKASLYDKAQKAVRTPSPKPAPQVQRPGPASSSKDRQSEQIKTLDQKLSRSGSRSDALALLRAMRTG